MATILGVIDMANTGAAVQLSFEAIAFRESREPLVICPDDALQDDDVILSRAWARWYTAAVLGWPVDHDLSVAAACPHGLPVPMAEGPSLFGAFCMGMMRLVAKKTPGVVRGWSAGLAETVRNTPLDRVAVSAAYDPDRGSFTPVGAIESKLAGLAHLNRDTCMLCVVAQDQFSKDTPRTFVDDRTGCFVMTTDLGHEIAVLEAVDPADAFRRLFALQASLLARHVLQ